MEEEESEPLIHSHSREEVPGVSAASPECAQVDRLHGGTPNSVANPEVIGHVQVTGQPTAGFSFKKLWAFTGPGFLMSIAYLDPGNIESDLQSGAIAKYKLLWVLMWSTVMGLVLQLLAARLGCVTGMHLAEVCRQEYPKAPRIVLWMMTELAIIGSDIQEVIGSAIAINLLSNHIIPIWAGVLITGVDTFTFLFLENAGLRKLEALFGAFITTMAAAFLYMYIKIKPDQLAILQGLWFPWCQDCDKNAIQQLVGIVGAVIMPHNIYLHSALVLSRSIDRSNRNSVKEANMYYAIESAIALFVSFLINLFVVAVFAAAFSDPKYAANPSLRKAGDWIAENYGLGMKIIWGIGVLAAGQSSTMTGTYAGQFVMEGFLGIRWAKMEASVGDSFHSDGAHDCQVALLATTELDQLNSWLNVLQSVQLPFALLPILHFTSSTRIMRSFKNGRVLQMVVWILALLVMGINLYLIYLFVGTGQDWYIYIVIALAILVYLTYVLYLALGLRLYSKLKMMLMSKLGLSTEACMNEHLQRESLHYPIRSLNEDTDYTMGDEVTNENDPSKEGGVRSYGYGSL